MSTSVDEVDLNDALKRALFSQAIPSWLVGMLTVLLCTIVLYGQVPQTGLIWWATAATIASLVRLPILLRASQQSDRDLPVKLYTALLAVTGVIWGSVALLWSNDLHLSDQLVIILAPLVICLGGIVSFSPWRPSYLVFVLATQIPLITILVLLEGASVGRLITPLVFFLVACVFLGDRFHYQHRETLLLRLRNLRLVNDLSLQNDSLLAARDEAQAACQTKDEFLARMSHELRTPMNGVLGVSQMLSKTSLDPEQAEMMAILQESGEGMLMLVDNLLDASSLIVGEIDLDVRPFSIAQVLDSIQAQLALQIEQKNLALTIEISRDVPSSLVGDERRIRQVLSALMHNAVKFTSSGGINVQVHREMVKNPALQESGDAKQLQVVISDTGTGIERSQLHRVSEFFHQSDGDSNRRFGGSGLGLSIAKSLVDLMNGSLTIESVINKGTSVSVSVPLPVDSAIQTVDVALSVDLLNVDAAKTNARVLVAEDNPINQMVIEAMLENLKCEVTVAENGVAALKALEDYEFDIVFMDCQMPELDGYAATLQARERGYQLPIVAVTANAMAGDRQKCLSVGMNDYVSKPFTADTITRMLNKWTVRDSLKIAG